MRAPRHAAIAVMALTASSMRLRKKLTGTCSLYKGAANGGPATTTTLGSR